MTLKKTNLLKMRFFDAVASGHLGTTDDNGTIITMKEFRTYFSDITSQYVNSFLPASTIEVGQCTPTHSRFVFRIRAGVYRLHPDVIDAYLNDQIH